MIHPRHGNAAGQERGFELRIEKMVKNYPDTAQRRLPEAGITQYPENGFRPGDLPYPLLHFLSTPAGFSAFIEAA
jgi:hypothetical protein